MRWHAFFLLLTVAPDLVSAWPINGVRLTGAPREQDRPIVASDGLGGAFVAWLDFRASGPPLEFGNDLYLQRVTSAGQIASGWPPDGLAIAARPGNQGASTMVPDGVGGALIPYRDASVDAGDIYLQRITAVGTIAPGWPAEGVAVAALAGDQGSAKLTSDGDGGAFVSWSDDRALTGYSTAYMTHVLGSGSIAPGWPATGRLHEPIMPIVVNPMLLSDGAGGFLAVWTVVGDFQYSRSWMLAGHYAASGSMAPGWPDGGALLCAERPANRVARGIVSDGAGGFYTAWEDYRNSSSPAAYDETDIYAQHMLANGTLAPGWPSDGLLISAVPGAIQWDVDLCEDGRGGVYIVWVDYRAGYAQVFGMHLGPDGQRHAGWPAGGRLLSNAFAFQLQPHLVWDGFEGAYLTWMNYEAAGYRTYVQHLTPSGAPAPGWLPNGVPVAATGGDQYEPRIVRDGGAGAIVAWGDSRLQAPHFMDIYAQRFMNDGVVAAQVSLASAEATPGEVRLRWHVSGETRANVERRAGDGEWEVRAEVEADGGGYMSHVDRDVEPGASYGYRLAFAGGVRGGETSVAVPAALALALEGARPNPANGALWVAFTLPDAARARLELFDLAGRQVAAREVGAHGAGRHVVRLDDGALAAGLYWAALTHGGRTLRARVVVVK